jgi:lambda family phage tail tape measure protein
MADILVTLGLNSTAYTAGLGTAQTQATSFSHATVQQLQVIDDTFKKLGATIGSIGFGALISKSAQMSNEIVNLSRAASISVGAVKGWQDSITAAGGEADNARDALLDLTSKMSQAVQGGGSLLKAFNSVGVSLKDLQTLSQQDIMRKVVSGLAGVKDGATRASLSMQLMGEDVKTVDFSQVNDQIDAFTQKADKMAPSLEQASKAQKDFNATYQKFLDQMVINIPWDQLSSGIKSIGDNLGAISSSLKIFGELGLLFVYLSRIVTPLTAALALFITQLMSAGSTVSIFASIAAWFRTIGSLLFEALAPINAVTAAAGYSLAALGIRFAALVAAIARIGTVVGVLYILKDILESITGIDIWDKIQQFSKPIFGFAETDKEEAARKDRAKKASEESLAATDKENQAIARKSDFLITQKKTVDDLVSAYRDQNEQILKGIENETSMIGLGEEQKRIRNVLLDLDKQHDAKLKEINDKIAEGGDPSVLAVYQSSINDINNAYAEQKTQIIAALNAEKSKIESDRLSVFTNDQLAAAMSRINNINYEASTIFLPLLEKKYRDIEKAANDAVDAQLKIEAQKRGVPVDQLPNDYVSQIKDAANAKVNAEKQAALSLEKSTELKKLGDFSDKTSIESNKKLRDIQYEMATNTLPEYQKISAQITKDAQDRAIAEIQAENARRGVNMSPEEESQYYQKAAEGTDRLTKAQQQSYKASREWSTGWAIALNKYVADATNMASKAESIFGKMMKGMEDLIVNFAKTGKFTWQDFLSMMLEELLRSQIQSTFAKMFSNMNSSISNNGSSGGSVIGNIFNSVLGSSNSSSSSSTNTSGWGTAISGIISGLFGGNHAEGGTIPRGKFGLVGENGPEFINGPATITPIDKMGSSSNSITNVNYNINAVDSRSFKQMIAADPSFLYGVTMMGAKGIPVRR